jgi:hypothetical protein
MLDALVITHALKPRFAKKFFELHPQLGGKISRQPLPAELLLLVIELQSWSIPKQKIVNYDEEIADDLRYLGWIVIGENSITLTDSFKRNSTEEIKKLSNYFEKRRIPKEKCLAVGKFNMVVETEESPP